MFTIERLKRLLALVIMACFFMPLSQCTGKEDPSHPHGAQPHDFVPFAEVEFRDFSGIAITGIFVWPLAAFAARRRFRGPLPETILNAAEGVLCVGSLYWLIEVISLWGEIRYGGILLVGAFASYLVGTCVVLFRLLRHSRRSTA